MRHERESLTNLAFFLISVSYLSQVSKWQHWVVCYWSKILVLQEKE